MWEEIGRAGPVAIKVRLYFNKGEHSGQDGWTKCSGFLAIREPYRTANLLFNESHLY